MGENSSIEWTDHSWNPWIGCTKISPGCANCYAEAQDKFRSWTPDGWGKGKPRKRTSESNWRQPLRWNKFTSRVTCVSCKAEYAGCTWNGLLEVPLCPRCNGSLKGHRPRVFCASLADWLDNEVPIQWLADLLKLIHSTSNLEWLLLTKRPENWQDRMCEAMCLLDKPWMNGRGPRDETGNWIGGWLEATAPHRGMSAIPQNIWIGTTVENQETADKRIPELLKIPAKVRFLSCEPLLEQVDLSSFAGSHDGNGLCWDWTGKPIHIPHCDYTAIGKEPPLGPKIDWVICGGESGPHARPMHPDWAFSLRDQCNAAGVPFFFKQWGEWHETDLNPKKGAKLHCWPDGKLMHKVGKKAAGRELISREWNEFPL